MVSWSKFVPFLGVHHILMMTCVLATIFLSVLASACTSSNGMSSVYLISLSYVRAGGAVMPSNNALQVNPEAGNCYTNEVANSNKRIQQVNVGFLALCVRFDSGVWICGSSARDIVNNLKGQESADTDPLNLVWIAEEFRASVVFYGFLIAAAVLVFIQILLLATFPGWHEDEAGNDSNEISPFPNRTVSRVCLGMAYTSFLLSFLTVFWQHIGSAAASKLLRLLSYGTIETEVGVTAMVLGWIGVFCTAMVALGLHLMIKSIAALTAMAQ